MIANALEFQIQGGLAEKVADELKVTRKPGLDEEIVRKLHMLKKKLKHLQQSRLMTNCTELMCWISITMFERICKSAGINARIAPVPRKLSSSCWLVCLFPCEDRNTVETFALGKKISVAGYHDIDE